MRLAMRCENKNTCPWLPRKKCLYKKCYWALNSLASNESQCVLWSDMAFVALWKIVSCTIFRAFLSFPPIVAKNLWSRAAKSCWKCWSVGAVFLAGANFWERHAKRTAPLCLFWAVFCLFWTLNLVLMFVGKVGWCQFSRLLQLCCGEGPCSVMARIMIRSSYGMLLIDPPQKSHYD